MNGFAFTITYRICQESATSKAHNAKDTNRGFVLLCCTGNFKFDIASKRVNELAHGFPPLICSLLSVEYPKKEFPKCPGKEPYFT